MTKSEINQDTFGKLRTLRAQVAAGHINHQTFVQMHEALIAKGSARIAKLAK